MKPLFEAINNIFVDDVEESSFQFNEAKKHDLSKHPYFKDLSDSTIRKRQKWIEEKKKKYAEDDYSVYKEKGPGDSKETKPSKHTKKVRKKLKKGLSLQMKSEQFNVPLDILKEVYRRGVGAWTTGSRPGVGPEQWGHGRVNSFLAKGKTYYSTDSDLALEWRKYKKKKRK